MVKICKKCKPCLHESMDIAHAMGTLQGWLMHELGKLNDEDETIRQSQICEWWQRINAFAIIENTLKENGLCK